MNEVLGILLHFFSFFSPRRSIDRTNARVRARRVSRNTIIAAIDRAQARAALTLRRNVETSGDDRRASVSKKRPRRTSTAAPRKDSVRPAKVDVKETPIVKDARELEQARRHRRIAMIVLGTFIFLLTASVLVVVITLTHSTFLSPAAGSKELAEHRAQCKFSSLRLNLYANPL